LLLCLALPGAALLWLGANWAVKRQTIYSAGPMSSAHAFFANRCEVCHATIIHGVKQFGLFTKHASDKACLACHQAPGHHLQVKQPQSPACSTCHVEHQGLVRLARVQDQQCLNCHADLKDKKSDTLIAASIHGFTGDQHPEFSALRKRLAEPPAIIFHHSEHMGKLLKTLKRDKDEHENDPVMLKCSNCHVPVAAEGRTQWKYNRAGAATTTAPLPVSADPMHPDARRELMTMPGYENQCAGCHDLRFDALVNESLAHPRSQQDVAALPALLEQKFRDYIQRHPEKIREPDPLGFEMPEQRENAPAASAGNWVQRRVSYAQRFLWTNTCKYCHQLSFPPELSGLPLVQKPGFKPRQMDDAIFSHDAHISVTCESCHEFPKAGTLANPEKLLPGIKTCQSCHSGSPAKAGKAEDGCFLCHQYHKWDPQRDPFTGKYTIEQLTGQ